MEVEIIKAAEVAARSGSTPEKRKLRVAAYCRVSTDDEDQIKSYNSMVRHYTDLIKSNKDWIFAGVFADKAITGTKDTREEFQRLIRQCLDGKIDLVIAKSIPRFARNTLDTIKYVRMLQAKNVAVYFEVERINTLTDGEFLLTILSSVAQQEVVNTSSYVKKGLQMKMKRGEIVGFGRCLGYDYDPATKAITVNHKESHVVQYIFDRYVGGAGGTIIARELNEQGIKTIRGNKWNNDTVIGIIRNEKYIGDVLMGKTYTVDPITKRRLMNCGEQDQYYIRDHHEPIISRELFEKAQAILNHRNGSRNMAEPGKRDKWSRKYAFSSMLKCSFCGGSMSRREWHSASKYKKHVWQCVPASKSGKKNCVHSKAIPEEMIEEAFVESYKLLCKDSPELLDTFLKQVEKALTANDDRSKLEEVTKKYDNLRLRRNTLLNQYLEGNIETELYKQSDKRMALKLQKYELTIEELQNLEDSKTPIRDRINEFKKKLMNYQETMEFDREIFESVIEKVLVGGYNENGEIDPYRLVFVYKTGFEDTWRNPKNRIQKGRKSFHEKLPSNCNSEPTIVPPDTRDVTL